MFQIDQLGPPKLGLTGLETELNEEQRFIQDSAHRFAREVMRPIAEKLDKLSADEVVAVDSPLWEFLAKLQQSGLLDLETIVAMDNQQMASILPLLFEELGWGDVGLTILALASSFTSLAALGTGDAELIERFVGKPGCWMATQPDRGSDCADLDAMEVYPGTRQGRGNLIARLDGDEFVINGQTSAWVSGAPIAQNGYLFCPCDFGEGLHNAKGGLNCIAALVPFDLPGVSKGKPLDKLGQRSLPQGEIYLDNVRIPKKYVLAEKEAAEAAFFGALTFANMEMGLTFTGLARAAYEHALAYVHERKQGGTQLINHQTVRLRIFNLWQKVESSRAMAHRAVAYNYGENGPHALASVTSKTLVTRNSLEVASEALLLFGGNGLSREYPMEKLLRDAQASLIEDGENTMLALKGGGWLSQAYLGNS
jgi:acyl-CoA dehydrogenase